jgi:glutathione S-transferase
MQLIGMLDSPYVRRTAVSLRLLGIPFEHHSVSVFSTFETFQKINPVVKAPTLVCDDGTVLMDSTLILDYAEAFAPGRKLMSSNIKQRQQELRVLGLALAACEKAVQIVYERNLRPVEKQYEPWLTRISGQLLAAYGELETEVSNKEMEASSKNISQAGVTTAVVWQFIQSMVADIVIASHYPALQAFSQRAERLPEFIAAPPDGPGVPNH